MQMPIGLALNISASPFSSDPQSIYLEFSCFPSQHSPIACHCSLSPCHLFSFHRKHWLCIILSFNILGKMTHMSKRLRRTLMRTSSTLHKPLLETVILHLVGFSCRFAISSGESCLAESAQGDAFPKCKCTYLHRKPIQFLIYITYLHRYFHIGRARVLLHHAFTPSPPLRPPPHPTPTSFGRML